MNFNKFIKPLIRDTIATILAASRDGYGNVTQSAVDQGDLEYAVKCRFQEKPMYIYSPTGVMEVSKAQVWVDSAASINEGHMVRYQNREYEVLSVEGKRDLTGRVLFKKVLLR